jgi:hypothetical protein
MNLNTFYEPKEASRLSRTLRLLAKHDLSRWALNGGTAIELYLRKMGAPSAGVVTEEIGRLAHDLIQKNGCSNVSFVAVRQYEVDPSGAERLLRDKSDSQDLAFGLDQFAAVAARKGNIVEALRLLNDLQNVTRGEKNVGLAEARATHAIHEIARLWTIKDGPRAVLKWARSRPTTEQRTWALIGMAEALGRATPRRYCL